MRGTDYALLDQLGRLTGGVAVLRPQGTPATLPDLPSFVSGLPGLIDDITGSVTKTYRGRPETTIPFCKVGGVSGKFQSISYAIYETIELINLISPLNHPFHYCLLLTTNVLYFH